MVALDAVKQLDPQCLDPEHPDAGADRRPLGGKIALDEGFRQITHLQPDDIGVVPINLPIPRQGRRAVQFHDLAREEPQMLGGFIAAARLVEAPAIDGNQGIAAEHPIGTTIRPRQRLGPRQGKCDLARRGTGQPGFKRNDPDFFALLLGNHILGGGGFTSRLTTQVREKRGLSYSVYSYFSPALHAGAFTVGLQTRPDQAAQAVEVARQVVKDFVENGPTEAELQAKRARAAVEQADMKQWPQSVLGAFVGLGLAWQSHWLPAQFGTPGLIAGLVVIVVALYIQIVNWVPIAINRSAMLFLTVLAAPILLEKLDPLEMAKAIGLGALYFGAIVKVLTMLSAPKTG